MKATWGLLSDGNNGTPGTQTAYSAPMLFPVTWVNDKTGDVHYMSPIRTPYVEVHAGITNILRLLRVDFNWRLTHRETARQKWSVTVGFEVSF